MFPDHSAHPRARPLWGAHSAATSTQLALVLCHSPHVGDSPVNGTFPKTQAQWGTTTALPFTCPASSRW